MDIIPKDEVSRFQLFLLLFLLSSLSATFLGAWVFAAVVVVFGAMCIFFARRLPRSQTGQAYALFGAFGLFSLVALLARQYATTPLAALVVFPAMAAGFALLFVLAKLFLVPWKVECRVIGYSEGYAIVETQPQVCASLAPGVYAIRSGPVRKGQRCFVTVERSVFGQGKPKGLAAK